MEQLSQLESLTIFSNHLTGAMPPKLIERRLSGGLWFGARTPNAGRRASPRHSRKIEKRQLRRRKSLHLRCRIPKPFLP